MASRLELSAQLRRGRIALHLVLCAAFSTTPTAAAAEESRGSRTHASIISPNISLLVSLKKGKLRHIAHSFATLSLTRDAERFDALLGKLKITPADLRGLQALRRRPPSSGFNRGETRLLDRLARQIFQATGENIVRNGILLAQERAGQRAVRGWLRGRRIHGPRLLEQLWRGSGGGEDPTSVILAPYYPSDDQAHQQDWYSTHIRRLKTERKPQLARAIVSHFHKRIKGLCQATAPEVIVGVPSSTKKRGAAQLLAHALARMVGVPFAAGAIQNSPHKTRTPQKKLGGLKLRLTNTSNTFIIDAEQVRGRRVLLVDDNLASGVTAEEIRLRLYQAGAAKVMMLNFGEAPMPWDTRP